MNKTAVNGLLDRKHSVSKNQKIILYIATYKSLIFYGDISNGYVTYRFNLPFAPKFQHALLVWQTNFG